MDHRVPAGVIRQTKGKGAGGTRYVVVGVALVVAGHHGFFLFEGFSPDGTAHETPGPRAHIEVTVFGADQAQGLAKSGSFDPNSAEDGREPAMTSILLRRGQPKFREDLLSAYGGRCAITGCDVEAANDAARITSYKGANTNVVDNGLLLRADIHTLFDLGKIAVETKTMTAIIAPSLVGTHYGFLQGQPLTLPKNPALAPSRKALDSHREWTGL